MPDANGSPANAWQEGLPEDIQQWDDEDWKTFHEKVQTKVPGLMQTPDFDDEESLTALYGKMGRPTTPEDYKLPEVKDDDGNVITINENRIKALAPMLHKSGLSQKQFSNILAATAKEDLARAAAVAQKQAEDKEALTEEWGAAEKQNRKIVTNFAKKFGAPATLLAGVEAGNVNSETMLWLHSLATQTLGNAADFQGDVNNGERTHTPAEASATIEEIMNNKQHAYWDKMAPGHKEAVERMKELYVLKDPKHAKNRAPGAGF